MFEGLSDEEIYKLQVSLVIVVLLSIVGGIVYFMKDTLFTKKVEFDPVVTEKVVDEDSDDYFVPSETFTGTKSGYVFTLRDEGQGYYKDN